MPLLFRWQKKNAKGRWVELRWTMEEEEAAQYMAKHNVELRKVPGSRGEESGSWCMPLVKQPSAA